jgi:hypothetical protein
MDAREARQMVGTQFEITQQTYLGPRVTTYVIDSAYISLSSAEEQYSNLARFWHENGITAMATVRRARGHKLHIAYQRKNGQWEIVS